MEKRPHLTRETSLENIIDIIINQPIFLEEVEDLSALRSTSHLLRKKIHMCFAQTRLICSRAVLDKDINTLAWVQKNKIRLFGSDVRYILFHACTLDDDDEFFATLVNMFKPLFSVDIEISPTSVNHLLEDVHTEVAISKIYAHYIACKWGNIKILRYLFEQQQQITGVDPFTCVEIAAGFGNDKCLRLILQYFNGEGLDFNTVFCCRNSRCLEELIKFNTYWSIESIGDIKYEDCINLLLQKLKHENFGWQDGSISLQLSRAGFVSCFVTASSINKDFRIHKNCFRIAKQTKNDTLLEYLNSNACVIDVNVIDF